MLLLLPPSEAKRAGGDATNLDFSQLSYPELTALRKKLLAALVKLSADEGEALRQLRLGPSHSAEVQRNHEIRKTPTMPAVERFTGVLYNALDVGTLNAAARSYAGGHLRIHSALFGIIGAMDPIPAYRFSHDSRLPDLGASLKAYWQKANSRVLSAHDGLVIDLRSEAYVALGPAPEGSVFIRVVTEDAAGRRRALNHFNKQAKGQLVRAFLDSRPQPMREIGELLDWMRGVGFRVEPAIQTGDNRGGGVNLKGRACANGGVNELFLLV